MFIENIIIVGGGTSGWMTAYWMKKLLPDLKIKVIASPEIDILGAGEGGLPVFLGWFKQCEVDLKEFFQKTGATVKLGIDYRDWYAKGENFLHPFTGDLITVGGVEHPSKEEDPGEEEEDPDMDVEHEFEENPELEVENANKQIRRAYVNGIYASPELNYLEWTSPFMEDGIPNHSLEELMEILSDNQMSGVSVHFDAVKVGEFFKEKCLDLGVEYFSETVLDIETDGEGSVTEVITKDRKFECDLIFDCSGQRRLISSKFEDDNDWWPFGFLTVNSALPFVLENPEGADLDMWTTAQAMEYGWMWKIPLQHRQGCGYVFDDSFIDFDIAQKEVEKFLRRKINPLKKISFQAGYLEKPWAKNCISIGMSQSFVEPLEATALGSVCVQHFMIRDLIHGLVSKFEEKPIASFDGWEEINWDEGDYKIAQLEYNALCGNIIREIADFVHGHYYTPRKDTEFWDSRKVLFNMGDEDFTGKGEAMSHKMKMWKNHPVYYEPETQAQKIYNEFNLLCVFDGLHIYDREERKLLLENHPFMQKWMTPQNLEDFKEYFSNMKASLNEGRLTQLEYLKKYELLAKT